MPEKKTKSKTETKPEEQLITEETERRAKFGNLYKKVEPKPPKPLDKEKEEGKAEGGTSWKQHWENIKGIATDFGKVPKKK